ncbi:MAG: macro domain-containing protein [Propionivibrio sp.]|nr:macro domain-containing protein [Propionivibrio sp.]
MENPNGLTPLAVRRLGTVQVEVVVGSLADSLGVAAVVNPTSASMGLDGGVGFSLAQRANVVELAAACRKLAPLEVARAVVTPGFGLPTPNIIHCRGPRRTDHDAVDKLAETYWSVLSLAEDSGFPSIAVPAISSGLKGFPLEESARIAIEALKSSSPEIRKVRKIRFVLPKPSAADIFARELLQPPCFSEEVMRFAIPVTYSPTEIQKLRQGYFGDHDTKWFFYHEEPWLCVYRGNREYGSCHFWLRLPDGSCHSPLLEALMDKKVEQYWGPTKKVEELVEYLLADRFELLRVADEDDDFQRVGNVRVAIRHGKLALDSSPDSVGLLPSELARELGDKLLRLADVLDREKAGE